MHLVLNTFGTSLTVENGLFVVEHTEGRQTIPAGKIKTISLGKGIKLSSDALLLALKEEIDVQFTDRADMPQGRLFNNKFGSIATIRRKQVEFAGSRQAVDWMKEIILRKAGNQMAILLALSTDNGLTLSQINAAIDRMEGVKKKIAGLEAASVEEAAPTFRGWEGQISHTYFQTVAHALSAQYRFSSRS